MLAPYSQTIRTRCSLPAAARTVVTSSLLIAGQSTQDFLENSIYSLTARNGMLAGFFRLMPEVFMERHALVRQHLHNIEQVLRDHQLWQGCAPSAEAFESTQPFCLDTMQPHEWLQWVLIPRMHALIDAQHPLPTDFAIAPYYEMALDAAHVGRDSLLKALQELDALFASETD